MTSSASSVNRVADDDDVEPLHLSGMTKDTIFRAPSFLGFMQLSRVSFMHLAQRGRPTRPSMI
jgi:hypothetical protein